MTRETQSGEPRRRPGDGVFQTRRQHGQSRGAGASEQLWQNRRRPACKRKGGDEAIVGNRPRR